MPWRRESIFLYDFTPIKGIIDLQNINFVKTADQNLAHSAKILIFAPEEPVLYFINKENN